jgi:hypothetical protein
LTGNSPPESSGSHLQPGDEGFRLGPGEAGTVLDVDDEDPDDIWVEVEDSAGQVEQFSIEHIVVVGGGSTPQGPDPSTRPPAAVPAPWLPPAAPPTAPPAASAPATAPALAPAPTAFGAGMLGHDSDGENDGLFGSPSKQISASSTRSTMAAAMASSTMKGLFDDDSNSESGGLFD